MRIRFLAGSLVAVILAFLAAVWAHEFTHILQAWHHSGRFVYDMEWNPTFNQAICEGHLACAGDRPFAAQVGFWMGEGIAYVVTYTTFPLAYWLSLSKLAGVTFKTPDKLT